MVGHFSSGFVGILRREALTGRPGESIAEAEEDEEEDLVRLRKDEEGVALVVDAGHRAVTHLWGGRAHANEAVPAS